MGGTRGVLVAGTWRVCPLQPGRSFCEVKAMQNSSRSCVLQFLPSSRSAGSLEQLAVPSCRAQTPLGQAGNFPAAPGPAR